MKNIYRYIYDGIEAEVKFEVDRKKFTKEHAQATLDFFLWDEPYDTEEDPVDEVMKKYAIQAIKSATFNNYTVIGVISDFENMEGFMKIDGTSGIKLLYVDGYQFDEEKLTLIEKKEI